MSITVELPGGRIANIPSILTPGDSNTKLAKGRGRGFLAMGISLTHAKGSGYQTCGKETSCDLACVDEAGLSMLWDSIKDARLARTIALYEHREDFREMLYHDLELAIDRAAEEGLRLCVRPNMFSDRPYERWFPEIFDDFEDLVQYYDYTKYETRVRAMITSKRWPQNYHLTFSRSEKNERHCIEFLKTGRVSVSVVYDLGNHRNPEYRPPLPETWNGFPVISGDETDLRFLDKPGHVIGLYAKRSRNNAAALAAGFIIPPIAS